MEVESLLAIGRLGSARPGITDCVAIVVVVLTAAVVFAAMPPL